MDDFSNPEIADSLEKAFRQLGGHVEGKELLEESLRAAKAAEKEEAVRDKAGGRASGKVQRCWAHAWAGIDRALGVMDTRPIARLR